MGHTSRPRHTMEGPPQLLRGLSNLSVSSTEDPGSPLSPAERIKRDREQRTLGGAMPTVPIAPPVMAPPSAPPAPAPPAGGAKKAATKPKKKKAVARKTICTGYAKTSTDLLQRCVEALGGGWVEEQ